MLLDREDNGLDVEARSGYRDCARLWLEVSAANAVAAHSMLRDLGPLEVGIVALKIPFAP